MNPLLRFGDWLQQPQIRELRDRCVWVGFTLLMGFVLGASLFSEQSQERLQAAQRGQAQQPEINQEGQPSLEQATPQARQQTGTSNNNQNPASPITTALQQIETALRDLVTAQTRPEEDKRKEQREIETLYAQKDQVSWAKYMFFATFGSIVLSVIGFLLLWRTLHHTRRSADAAHDANKPWIEAVVTEKLAFRFHPKLTRIELMISLRNRGNSPATGVMARAILVAVPEDYHSEQNVAIARLEEMMDHWDSSQPDRGMAIFPGVEMEPKLYGSNIKPLEEVGHGKKARFWLAVGVRYKFGDRGCRTVYAYMLTFPGRPQTLAISDDPIEFGPEQFELTGMAMEYAT